MDECQAGALDRRGAAELHEDRTALASERLMSSLPFNRERARNSPSSALRKHSRSYSRIRTTEPLSYVAFINLVMQARLAITDSGGVPEETTYLGIRCATFSLGIDPRVSVPRVGTDTSPSARRAVLRGFSKIAD